MDNSFILNLFILIILIFVFHLLLVVGVFIDTHLKKKKINEKIDSLTSCGFELTVEEFFQLRNFSFGGRGSPKYALTKNCPGVYILYNKTKNMYYVGQAQKLFDRVNKHFTGKGNGDVYADYKYGDYFTIKMISLGKSGYYSLNALEKDTISRYNAFSRGYNKTRGNSN